MGRLKAEGPSVKASTQVGALEERRTDDSLPENASIEHIGLVNADSVVLEFTNGSSVMVDSEELKTLVLNSASKIVNADDVDEESTEK